ncbi:MAG: hypothetical protein ACI9G9_000436 [Psychromonas sp.]|jgi:hypothetical protein
MKTLITILAIIANSLIYTSCCKGPYPVAGLTVSYPNLSSTETLKAVRTDKNNLSTIIDTISIGELNTSNNYSTFIEFKNEPPNYILYIENTQYVDTISEILVERKGCKEKIKNFQYKFNGQIRTDNKLLIN